jgi:SSS family solute:Na+ symporter
MHPLGLNIIDLIVVIAFLLGVIGLGWWASRGVKEEKDFYLGGRKLGRTLQFFLSFGNMTDSSGAPTTSAEVFRQGAGGTWISLQTLFITPFYWFSANWFRRVRVTTMADMFVERLNSKGLALAYVLFNIYVSLLLLAFGNVVSYKVASAMMVKPASDYSPAEQHRVAEYNEYAALKSAYTAQTLGPEKRQRYEQLDSMVKLGQINSFVSAVTPFQFYFFYTLIVAVYIGLGGLKAAAVTDALQGLLTFVFTLIMIPLGLARIGGFHAMHQAVPEFMFRLFGTVTASDYAWYSIAAIAFTSMVQIFGTVTQMSMAGSATNENAARFGLITGAFTKRLVIIAWTLCGLIAVALFPGGLADPENSWGVMAKTLLAPGLMGLMFSGMLLGHMPTVGSNAIAVAGLIARNIYEPLVKGKTEAHYLKVGQVMLVVTLAASLCFSMLFSGAVKLITEVITFNVFFGAVILLIFFWRRLSAPAIWASLAFWIVFIGIAPSVVPEFQGIRRNATLTQVTDARSISAFIGATQDDVTKGLATKVGAAIQKSIKVPPVSIYFDTVAHANPQDPTSPMEGVGRFQVETYLLHLIGVPVRQFNKAGILTARWGVDGILPFLMLIVFSYLLPGRKLTVADQHRIDGFFAKLKTPVAPTPAEDELEVAASYENPHRFDHRKLFPGSTWEFSKWRGIDYVGFLGCWGIVGLIIGFLLMILNLGA